MTPTVRRSLINCVLVFVISALTVHASASEINISDLPPLEKLPQAKHRKITREEKAANYGLVFVAQVGTYVTSQSSVIKEHGSWRNWIRNPTSPHFDKDSFDFNLVKHSFVGQYYYLFYRSRGYGERQSFYWAAISSLTFEFGIETFTEKPSYQDIYQTPVFGTIVGMGTERLSDYFHSIGTVPTTILAYILNPFTLLPGSKCDCGVMPVVGSKGEAGFVATLNF
jgi:Domain of unknown function (DUF3943)